MARWGNKEGQLFRFRNGRQLTRASLDDALKKALQQPQQTQPEDQSGQYSSMPGVENSGFNDLGRWKSRACLGYIHGVELALGIVSLLALKQPKKHKHVATHRTSFSVSQPNVHARFRIRSSSSVMGDLADWPPHSLSGCS